MPRYLRAWFLAVALLSLNRLLGLARESVLAAGFGATPKADALVVMLTLPDLLANVLATGALGYVLLPWWARQLPDEQNRTQARVLRALLALGAVLALAVIVAPQWLADLLAPGVVAPERLELLSGLRWAALAVPAALTAALWYTRLQQHSDVTGMYGMNAVHNGVVIPALLLAAFVLPATAAVHVIGISLLAALLLRAAWLRWRLAPLSAPLHDLSEPVVGLPLASVWVWAVLATGLPQVLPVLARTLVSDAGGGAIATFNYAWKLVELPNQLAIQLVTTLAFPALARARAEGRGVEPALRSALVLAWTLACASALALFIGAAPLARLLFGWGRMEPSQVAEVAQWSAWGAWTLLPQAVIAVLSTVLAALGRVRAVALAYAAGLIVLWGVGAHEARAVLITLTVALTVVAASMALQTRAELRRALAWREVLVPAALCAALAVLAKVAPLTAPPALLALAVLASLALLGVSYAASPHLRGLLRKNRNHA